MYKVLSPVIFIIFNRPDLTRRVFSEIAKVEPRRLLIIADGARLDRPHEESLCNLTRQVVGEITWPCEVSTNYSTRNLGCKIRIASGLDWAFSMVQEGIILEDDCLPAEDFFRFCDEMLDRYRNNSRIGMISGNNFQDGVFRGDGDYYFSRYCHIWGWATWARAWQKYDIQITQWPMLRSNGWLKSLHLSFSERLYWSYTFNRVYSGDLDTWDHQWTMTCWLENMISIMPNKNLISNIGFGPDATHTVHPGKFSKMDTANINFPLKHPSNINVDCVADIFTSKQMFGKPILQRLVDKFKLKLGFAK